MEGNEQVITYGKYIIFDSELQAATANADIAINMHLTGNRSTGFATPSQRLDGKWYLPFPESEAYLDGVEAYTVEECLDKAAWFGEEEEGK